MAKLIPMEEAAQMLGMSVEQLTEMRSQNEIFGYRDGASWKFKIEEVKRVAEERNISIGNSGSAAGNASDVLDDDMDFQLSDSELLDGSGASNVNLDDSNLDFSLSGSDLLNEGSGDLAANEPDSEEIGDAVLGDELIETDSEELSFGSSDISLAADDSGTALGDEEPNSGSPSDTGKLLSEEESSADEALFSDEELSLEGLSLDDSIELSSDFDDSDLVLDDSDSNAELALEANDSGINLSPTDSGISLEDEPLELGGSDIDSLELPEDDEMISLEEAADLDAPTELQSDDDFNLTPLEDSLDDESSGSQVIALEDSEIYTDDSVPSMLSDSDVMPQPALMPDDGFGEPDYSQGSAMAGGAAVETVPETPYSLWQVLSLGLVLLMSILCAMVAVDLARHIWQGDADGALTATVMDFFVRLTGWNN